MSFTTIATTATSLTLYHLSCILACFVSGIHYYQVPSIYPPSMMNSMRNNSQIVVEEHSEEKMIEPSSLFDWQSFRRVCYFRMDPITQMEVAHIDGNLCSHVIFAFCRLDLHGNVIFGAQSDAHYLEQIPKLKQSYPHLKVLVSIYNEIEYQGFVRASKSDIIRKRFVQSALNFMKTYHLDGIDLDWEFPNFPKIPFYNGRLDERTGFTRIVRCLKQAFGSQYLLTSAVAAQDLVLSAAYEIPEVSHHVDWFNLMTYDYHLFKYYTPFTGPNSPLLPITSRKVPFLRNLSIDWSVKKYLSLGVPREKIVLGVPTYARGYRLLFPTTSKTPKSFMLAIAATGGKVSDYYDYREICQMMQQDGVKFHYDERACVPYMIVPGSIWISYENERSVRNKIEYAINMNLGGYMTWNLNSDNFDRACVINSDGRKNVLHSAMMDHARRLITLRRNK